MGTENIVKAPEASKPTAPSAKKTVIKSSETTTTEVIKVKRKFGWKFYLISSFSLIFVIVAIFWSVSFFKKEVRVSFKNRVVLVKNKTDQSVDIYYPENYEAWEVVEKISIDPKTNKPIVDQKTKEIKKVFEPTLMTKTREVFWFTVSSGEKMEYVCSKDHINLHFKGKDGYEKLFSK